MKIYRYVSFEMFVDMAINNRLTLLSPRLWEDPYEGWFWKAFMNSESVGTGIRKLYNTIFAQSWSRDKDSAALWSIYSHGNRALMIESTKDKLEGLDSLFCKEVKYSEDANVTIDDLISLISSPSEKTLVFPFTAKRSAFRHENEIRVFCVVDDGNTENKDTINVSINNIQEIIDNVTVHPLASNWYVEIVKLVCEKIGISFYGKSHLYDIDQQGDL